MFEGAWRLLRRFRRDRGLYVVGEIEVIRDDPSVLAE